MRRAKTVGLNFRKATCVEGLLSVAQNVVATIFDISKPIF